MWEEVGWVGGRRRGRTGGGAAEFASGRVGRLVGKGVRWGEREGLTWEEVGLVSGRRRGRTGGRVVEFLGG